MRKMLITCAVAFLAHTAFAGGTNGVSLVDHRSLRQVGDKIYNKDEVARAESKYLECQNQHMRKGKSAAFAEFSCIDEWKPYSVFKVHGIVAQVLDEGLLVELTKEAGVLEEDKRLGIYVFLKNYDQADSVLDGSKIDTTAFVAGRHQYTTTNGSRKTIALYDCGQRVAEDLPPEHISPLPLPK